jgi:hypothetical protein
MKYFLRSVILVDDLVTETTYYKCEYSNGIETSTQMLEITDDQQETGYYVIPTAFIQKESETPE